MAKAPKVKAIQGVARVRGKKKAKAAKSPTAILPPDVLTAIGVLLSWIAKNQTIAKVLSLPTLPATDCCTELCKNVGAGKKMLVICDGTTQKPWSGTADGQYPKWDNTAGTWVLSTV